jgi:hypothetical protein
VEHDALVLQGDVMRGKPVVWGSFFAWFVGACACVGFAARGGDIDHPPVWLLAVCIGVTAAGIIARIVGSKLREFTTLRLSWAEVCGASPMGLAMRLFTTRGDVVLVGLGPSGPAELHRLGECIVWRRATSG